MKGKDDVLKRAHYLPLYFGLFQISSTLYHGIPQYWTEWPSHSIPRTLLPRRDRDAHTPVRWSSTKIQ